MNLPHIALRVLNTPLAIAPTKAEIILDVLKPRFFSSESEMDFEAKVASNLRHDEKSVGYQIEHEVGIIPITGTLVHKSGYLTPMSGMTGYDCIRHNFAAALADPKVKAIAFDIDSPGGEVAGCFDLVEMIYRSRGKKPMMAILSECAYSAAYAIATAADIICVPASGGTGSVGVVACHADYSERLASEGVKITMVHYGAKKVDGNETAPLSDSARERLQSDVDKMGDRFVRCVARNRGMTVKAVRETEAGIYMGKDGVDVGFADQVLAPEHAFEALVNSI